MKWRINGIFFSALGCLTCFTILLTLHLSKVEPEDQKKWQKLVEESKSKKNAHEHYALSEQVREGVSKEIYIEEENSRYCRIDSPLSKLTICLKNDTLRVEESFEEMSALLQERCYYVDKEGHEIKRDSYEEVDIFPMQAIHILKSKRALFDYTNKELYGENVDIYSYSLPGHTPPKLIEANPDMIGKADSITIELEEKNPCLHSTYIQVLFSAQNEEGKRYIIAPQMHYFFKEDKMFFEGNEEEFVYLYDVAQKTAISAKQIEASSLFKPGQEKITTKENVRVVIESAILEKIKKQLR